MQDGCMKFGGINGCRIEPHVPSWHQRGVNGSDRDRRRVESAFCRLMNANDP